MRTELLARAGIHITPYEQAWRGWGWSIVTDDLRRDWEGPYQSPEDATLAALTWLVQRAAQTVTEEPPAESGGPDLDLETWRKAVEDNERAD